MSDEIVAPVELTPEAGDSKTKETKELGPAINVTVGTIFDLIGQLRLVARQKLNLSIPIPELPLTSVMERGELLMQQGDRTECNYRIWYDTPNNQRYVILTHDKLIQFTTIDEYVKATINDANEEIDKAKTYLIEPPRVDISNELCYDPDKLGIPYSDICRYGILDDRSRVIIRNLCRSIDFNQSEPSNVILNSFEYAPRAETRARLMSYAITRMPAYHARIQEMIDVANSAKYKVNVKLQMISQWDFLYPVCPYNEISSPLDGFNISCNMRHEIMTELIGFNIHLDSKSGSSFTKLANQSVNRPSYFTDMLGLSYSDSMAEEISAYMSSRYHWPC